MTLLTSLFLSLPPLSFLPPSVPQEVHCTGQESNVDECNHDDYGLHTCIGGHDEDAGVICEGMEEVREGVREGVRG